MRTIFPIRKSIAHSRPLHDTLHVTHRQALPHLLRRLQPQRHHTSRNRSRHRRARHTPVRIQRVVIHPILATTAQHIRQIRRTRRLVVMIHRTHQHRTRRRNRRLRLHRCTHASRRITGEISNVAHLVHAKRSIVRRIMHNPRMVRQHILRNVCTHRNRIRKSSLVRHRKVVRTRRPFAALRPEVIREIAMRTSPHVNHLRTLHREETHRQRVVAHRHRRTLHRLPMLLLRCHRQGIHLHILSTPPRLVEIHLQIPTIVRRKRNPRIEPPAVRPVRIRTRHRRRVQHLPRRRIQHIHTASQVTRPVTARPGTRNRLAVRIAITLRHRIVVVHNRPQRMRHTTLTPHVEAPASALLRIARIIARRKQADVVRVVLTEILVNHLANFPRAIMRTVLRTPAVANHHRLPMRIGIVAHLLDGIRNMRIFQFVEPAQIEVSPRSHTAIRGRSVVVRHPHAATLRHHTRTTR